MFITKMPLMTLLSFSAISHFIQFGPCFILLIITQVLNIFQDCVLRPGNYFGRKMTILPFSSI